MSDLIDRQAAIDALFALYEYQRSFDPTEAADLVRQGIFLAEKKIEKLPSAQPECKRGCMPMYADVSDCISRQAAIEVLSWFTQTDPLGYTPRQILSALPSADAVPVVRCKDCKHRYAEDGFCEGRGWPMQLVPDDGFCDKGERSEE